MNTILAVGSMAFDSIQSPAGKADLVLGGSCNYFSIASSLFAPVRVIAVVGEDFPLPHLDWLKSRGIDVSGVEVHKGHTFHWSGQYDTNLNEAKTLATELNVFEHFSPKLNGPQADSPYIFLGNIDPTLQLRVLDQVRGSKLIVCDSMNLWINIKPTELKQVIRRVDILSLNEGEAYLLSGHRNLIRAAGLIRDMGPSVVIIKRGEYGASLFTPNSIFFAPAFPVQNVVDPTGAGDSFAGAFLGHLAAANASRELATQDPKGWEKLLRQSVLTGCVMASFTVEDFSIHRLMRVTRTEFENRRSAFFRMVEI